MAVHPSGRYVLLGHGRFLIRWTLNEAPDDTFLEAHDPIASITTNEAEDRIVCAHSDESITLWDLNMRRELARVHPHEAKSVFGTVQVLFAKRGETLISGGRDGQLILLDSDNLRTIRKLYQGNVPVDRFTISPDGQQVVFKTAAQEVVVVQTDGTGRTPLQLPVAPESGLKYGFSSDGKQLCLAFTRDDSSYAFVCDSSTGSIINQWKSQDHLQFCGIEFLKGNRTVIMAAALSGIYRWDLDTNEWIAPPELAGRGFVSCCLLPDERRLLMPYTHGVLVYDVRLQLQLCGIPFPDITEIGARPHKAICRRTGQEGPHGATDVAVQRLGFIGQRSPHAGRGRSCALGTFLRTIVVSRSHQTVSSLRQPITIEIERFAFGKFLILGSL